MFKYLIVVFLSIGCGQVDDLLNKVDSYSDPNVISDQNSGPPESISLEDGNHYFNFSFNSTTWSCTYETSNDFMPSKTGKFRIYKTGIQLFLVAVLDDIVNNDDSAEDDSDYEFISSEGTYNLDDSWSHEARWLYKSNLKIISIFVAHMVSKDEIHGIFQYYLATDNDSCNYTTNFVAKRYEDTEAPSEDSESEDMENTENGGNSYDEGGELQCPSKVYSGLSKTCVLEILGEPDRISSYTGMEWWYYEAGHPAYGSSYAYDSAYVYFRNGRLVEHHNINKDYVDLTR